MVTRFLQQRILGLTFVLVDGRTLPFKDASFDFGHSSAVPEHVGSQKGQRSSSSSCGGWLVKACS